MQYGRRIITGFGLGLSLVCGCASPRHEPTTQPPIHENPTAPPHARLEPLPAVVPAQFVEASDVKSDNNHYPLDLATALQLAGSQNPLVSLAQEQIRHAEALEENADALWLPSIRGGVGWNRHEGTLQDTSGNVISSSRNSLYTGLGAGAVGAGSPVVPGVQANFHLADALYRPLAARQARTAREHAAAAVLNDTLLQVCQGYLELLRAEQDAVIAAETFENARKLAELTAQYAIAGQGLKSDAERMQVELSLRHNDLQKSEEAVAVASARLNESLSLEPGVQLQCLETVVTPWKLVSTEVPLTSLIEQGLCNRPELAERRALVYEAQQNLRREEMSPRLPHLAVGASYGGFGGGKSSSVDNFNDRVDLDAVAYWELRNLGFGDQAARRAAQAEVGMASLRQSATSDRVVREIAEAFAQVQARRRQIETARQAILSAQDSYQHNVVRIKNVQGLPIEVLQSIQALSAARREYLRSVIDFNTAQFALLRAVGWRLYQVDLSTTANP